MIEFCLIVSDARRPEESLDLEEPESNVLCQERREVDGLVSRLPRATSWRRRFPIVAIFPCVGCGCSATVAGRHVAVVVERVIRGSRPGHQLQRLG